MTRLAAALLLLAVQGVVAVNADAARRGPRKPAAQPKSLLEPTLELPSDFDAEPDLRDAPAAWQVAAGLRTPPATTMLLEAPFSPEGEPQQHVTRVPMDAGYCSGSAQNLRFMIRAAADSSRERPSVVRKRLGSGLRRELALLRRREPADDARVSLLTTDAEMELEAALKKLDDSMLSPNAFRSLVLGPAGRAARNLELAAGRLAP